MNKIWLLLIFMAILACNEPQDSQGLELPSDNPNAKITFIELGSGTCAPCKAMKPVLKSIAKKYGDQINVISYDVMKPDQQKYIEIYDIRLMPTQVILDANGNEIKRHEGFFAEKEIDAFLQMQGLVIQPTEARNS